MRKFIACSVALATVLSVAGLAMSASAAPSMSPKQTQGTEPNAATIARDLQRLKLPIRLTVVYTAKTDPSGMLGRRDGYTSKAAFVDRRVENRTARKIDGIPDLDVVVNGGGVEIWPSAALEEERATYLLDAAIVSPGYDLEEFDFVSGDVLLRLSPYLTARAIGDYVKALRAITHKPVSEVKVPTVGATNVVSGPRGSYSVKLVRLITTLRWLGTPEVAGTVPVATEFRVINTSREVLRDDADADVVILGSNSQIYGPLAGVGIGGCTDFNDGSFVIAAGASAVGCTLFAVAPAAFSNRATIFGLRISIAKVQWSPDAGQGTVGSWTVGDLVSSS